MPLNQTSAQFSDVMQQRVEQSEARVLFGPVKSKTETEQDRLALF